MCYNSIIGTDFNPRSREGSDTMSKKLSKKPIDFNPRSREGSDPEGVYVYVIPKKFQSTLPRGERQRAAGNQHGNASISIHAPARGATETAWKLEKTEPYFNPRSREGSDPSSYPFGSISPYFNPRSREGSDQELQKHHSWPLISIRAPARGATSINSVSCGNVFLFQSALPRGERQRILIPFIRSGLISIRAPARGATSAARLDTLLSVYFNPRSREGSDVLSRISEGCRANFNPRSREGSDDRRR